MQNTAISIRVPQIKKAVMNVTPNFNMVVKTAKAPSKMSKAEYRKKVNEEMRQHVSERVPMMMPGKLYKLKMICTKEFWNRHYAASHRGQGRYISKLVKDGRLPLVNCGPNTSKSTMYRLK